MRDEGVNELRSDDWVNYEWTSPTEVSQLRDLILTLKLEPEDEATIRKLIGEMLDNAFSKGIDAGSFDL